MAFTARDLGFDELDGGWRKVIGGRELVFRRLRSRADLEQTERIQREVFGVSERDLASFSILIIVHKTGGEVLGAFDGAHLAGFVSAYGGFVGRQPRLVSDMMLVEPRYRGGLGYALKALQAAVALEAGFEYVVWTVDPLRAANARLNFERLGATCNEYVEDLYGGDFATGLYGGMPSDRLIVGWRLTSERVGTRLLHGYQPRPAEDMAELPDFAPATGATRARLAIPSDVDVLLARDPAAALAWRYRLRANLERAFDEGFVITGFAGVRSDAVGYYLLERAATQR